MLRYPLNCTCYTHGRSPLFWLEASPSGRYTFNKIQIVSVWVHCRANERHFIPPYPIYKNIKPMFSQYRHPEIAFVQLPICPFALF